ncbi:MAG: Holliday junction resolvase RuvX [Sneathiellaceae bacterium]
MTRRRRRSGGSGPAPGEMPSLPALAALVPPDRRLLSLDLGTKTIGIAIADAGRRIATPLETLRRGKPAADIAALQALIAGREVGGLVIGLPVNMDGSEGPRCQSARAMGRNLHDAAGLPYAFWDERMSTMAVTRTLLEADASRARRAEVVDKLAAAYILQGALDLLDGGRI